MSIILEVAIAAAMCAAVICMAVITRSLLGAPAPKRGGGTVYTVIAAQQDTTGLEFTVAAAQRLHATGAMRSRIVIADCGMDDDCRREAEILANDSNSVILCTPEDLPYVIGEYLWRANTYK